MTDLPVNDLLQHAMAARERAYAPYSHFLVGAAIHCVGDGKIFAGCNVENASYGGTICAERSAIVSMVSQRGFCRIDGVVVVTNAEPASCPCGLCLQVLAEFCSPSTPVYLANLNGIQKQLTMQELLPHSFTEVPGPAAS
ncbi:MAG: cytidine deaminase [Verrucomicrobia bacterium]|nr:cytidine deaminase [Verrucomicrobiota bacterium]